MRTVFTIGHSNREIDVFLDLLKVHGIELIIDVRKMPRSRSNPQFNGPELAAILETHGIAYSHLESLTGFRKGAKVVSRNAWENKSFQAYAAYMETADFARGIDELIQRSQEKATAVMCSEAVWWRCHRRMIADALLARGWEVRHILSQSSPSPHELTKFARAEAGRVTYPEDPAAPPSNAPKKPTRGAPHRKRNQPPAEHA